MQSCASTRAPRWFAALLALVVSPFFTRAADISPVLTKPAGNAPVTVKDDGNVFILDNGILTARINKRYAELEALVYQGADVLGHDQGRVGGWEQEPSAAAKIGGLTQSITIDPATNGGARAEISIKGVTKGDPNVGLTPGSPGAPATGTRNLDLEIRYAMARGESGLHVYAIYSHPADYGALNMPESRYIIRLNQKFDWISVDADRNMLECAPRDWGTGVVVHAKEQRIMSQGVYKNSVEHKYSYNAVQYKIPAYGWSSTQDHVGVWFINPTIEYLSGGATKQELVCHFGDNDNPDPIILNYWRGTHYGGGAPASIAAGEAWTKVVGPMMIYVNSLEKFATPSPADLATLKVTEGNPTVPPAWHANATALWQDALAQAKQEKAAWPYDWVNGVDYPHKNERGTVTGRILLDDPQAASKKLPHLTVGLAYPDAPGSAGANLNAFVTVAAANNTTTENASAGNNGAANGRGAARGGGRGASGARGGFGPRPGDWVHDSKHYQFWTDGTDDGAFTLTNVRPGTYTLHAFADGVLGEFAKAEITVEAGKTINLGTLDWKPVRYGKQLWEIGYSDRTGGKFFKGDGANYWLWGWGLRYPLLFPNDVTYTVGKSDYRKDWFFQQTPHSENREWLNPEAKDPANQRFGWVKAESLEKYPQSNQRGPWEIYGRGRACTWTIKFDLDHASAGVAALRIALAGADAQQLEIGVNGHALGAIRPVSTNALRYNTNKAIWQEHTLKFDATLLHAGENIVTLTVPAGDLTTGVVYDYLRLELDSNARLDTGSVAAN
jgi:rhamnogalacturonan endolyase